MQIVDFRDKSADQILESKRCLAGDYLFRSMAWIDYHKRNRSYPPLLYACVEARQGIEYILFDILVVSTGGNITIDDYKKCIKNNKFVKTIKKLSPNYERLQKFTKVITSIQNEPPNLIYWEVNELIKVWQFLSTYLHWFGVRSDSTENHQKLDTIFNELQSKIVPLWDKYCSGDLGLMRVDGMHPKVFQIWKNYSSDIIDIDTVKLELSVLKLILEK
jgi:hypothetical protein